MSKFAGTMGNGLPDLSEDERLEQRLRAKDTEEDAYREFCYKYHDYIHNLAGTLLHDDSISDEVAVGTLLDVWNRRKTRRLVLPLRFYLYQWIYRVSWKILMENRPMNILFRIFWYLEDRRFSSKEYPSTIAPIINRTRAISVSPKGQTYN